MATGDGTIVRRYYDGIMRRGRQITLRHVDPASGPNPPTIIQPVVNGAVAANAMSISIRGNTASGKIVAGDQIVLAGVGTYTVGAPVAASVPPADVSAPFVPGFANIPLTTRVAAPGAADGAPVSFIWSADQSVWCALESFSLALQGNSIIAGDVHVLMPAYGLSAPPKDTDVLIVDGLTKAIVVCNPQYKQGLVVYYDIQAR